MLDTDEEKVAFTEIYESYKYACLHVAENITGNQMIAEDAVHNAFIALIRHKDKYLNMPRCKLKSQIVIIVKNKAIDLLRGEQHRSDTPIEELPDDKTDSFDISEFIASDESYRNLVDCVSRLPVHYRVVFQLRYFHELSDKEIADKLNEPQRHVAMKLHRAKKVLRERLLKEGEHVG
jgi:RNA polymerase sigma-70 factor (ECF subfamily)